MQAFATVTAQCELKKSDALRWLREVSRYEEVDLGRDVLQDPRLLANLGIISDTLKDDPVTKDKIPCQISVKVGELRRLSILRRLPQLPGVASSCQKGAESSGLNIEMVPVPRPVLSEAEKRTVPDIPHVRVQKRILSKRDFGFAGEEIVATMEAVRTE